MTAMYPLAYRGEWTHDKIADAVSGLAKTLGYFGGVKTSHIHEDNAQRIIDEFIRNHASSDTMASDRFLEQRSLLLEKYRRWEYRWIGDSGEIVLTLADDNVIPFPSMDITTSGTIGFACGFVDFVMPDREIDRLGIDAAMRGFPLLYADG